MSGYELRQLCQSEHASFCLEDEEAAAKIAKLPSSSLPRLSPLTLETISIYKLLKGVAMTVLTHSCLRSASLLSARPSFTPFSRKAPLSRKFLAPVNQFHAPSWYPHLTPETFLVQVKAPHRCRWRSRSFYAQANDAFPEWQLLYAVMLHIRRIILLTALIASLLWIAQHFTQVRLFSLYIRPRHGSMLRCEKKGCLHDYCADTPHVHSGPNGSQH